MSVKQQHYRRLMKEQKAKSSSQKIDHPLAKYNALGQLTCIVCTAPVKSELIWNTHLQSRKHKDNVTSLKSKQNPPSTAGIKRKQPELEPSHIESQPSPKKLKPDDPTNNVTNSSLPSDFFDSGPSKDTAMEVDDGVDNDVATKGPLPADFFDSKPKTKSILKKQTPPSPSDDIPPQNSSLPEGFFDDPKQDAKARKVEFKDPELEEWEKFKKSIQKEDDVSDALVLERDEESKEDREASEIQEQASCFLRAETLRQKQEKLLETKMTTTDTNTDITDNSSSDELDFDELFDWRSKVS